MKKIISRRRFIAKAVGVGTSLVALVTGCGSKVNESASAVDHTVRDSVDIVRQKELAKYNDIFWQGEVKLHNSTFESGASFLSDRDIGPDIANGYTIRRISQENGSSHQTFFVDHYVRMGIPPAVENEYHGNLDENDIQEFFKEGWMPKDVNPLIEIFNLLLDDSSSEERGFRTAFKGFIKDKTTIDEIKEFFEVDIVSCNEIHKYTHNKITPAVAKSYNYGADSTVKFVKHGVDNKYANLFKEIRSDDWKIVSRAFRGYIGHIDWTSDIIELHERKVSKDKIKAYAKLNSDYGVNINPEDMLNYERRGIKFSTIRAEAEKRYAAKLLE